jgi:uncharacterized protein YlxW (UPF0749 family)
MTKGLTILLCRTLSLPTQASLTTDFFGAIFTIITSLLHVVAPDNPTLRKNNPLRKKVSQEIQDLHEELKRQQDELTRKQEEKRQIYAKIKEVQELTRQQDEM